VTNAASAPASGLRARLTVTNCSLPGNDKEKSLGSSLAAGKTQTVSASWQIQPTAGKACHLTLEVIATYEIPDLQYSLVERAFTPQPVTQEVNKPKQVEQPAPVTEPKPETRESNEVWGRWQCNIENGGSCKCIYEPDPWTPGTCTTIPGHHDGCWNEGQRCGPKYLTPAEQRLRQQQQQK
jgi:hypothetical protein